MSDGPYVIAIDGSGCSTVAVGGKAAGLDRLASHGFPIPTSFGITTAAYRRFVDEAGLDEWVAALAGAPPPDPSHLDEAARMVESRFLQAPLPQDVHAAIHHIAVPLLEAGEVAVRSSASAEDLDIASFAGQYRSFLALPSVDEVIDAVRLCWASLWHPSVRAYRRHNGISEVGLAMGVVVQAMVNADWSGVGFTVDPERRATGLRIEVVPGLGEALVSGRVKPHDFVVDRTNLAIAATDHDEPLDFLEDLARMLLQVEDRLDAPQDVEWSSVDGRITLLQARPITVAGPTAAEDDGFDGPVGTQDTFTPRGVVEMLPDVVPPLLWTISAPMIEDAFRNVVTSLGGAGLNSDRRFVGRFRGRGALNLSALREVAGALPGGSEAEVERQFLGRPMSLEPEEHPKVRGPRRLSGALRNRRAQRRISDEIDLTVAAVSGIVRLDTDLGGLPTRRLVAYRAALRDLAWRLTAAEVAASSAAAAAYRALELLLANWLGETDATQWAQRLTAGSLRDVAVGLGAARRLDAAYAAAVGAHPSLRRALRARPIERAPERIRQLGPAGRGFLAEVEWIMRSQGSRAIYAGPTWAEDGTWAWEYLARAAASEDHAPPSQAKTPIAELTDVLHDRRKWRLSRIVTGQIVDLRLRWLSRQTAEASHFLALREEAKGALLMLGGEERRAITEGANRLVASCHIAHRDEVELLADGEFAAMLLGAAPPSDAEMFRRGSVLRRCRAADRLPQTFVGAPGARPPVLVPTDAVLVGWAASAGVAEGKVKVVDDLAAGAKLEQGDVLVARATDPSWTPLLLIAGALVLEEGGPLSHGAIVAREFGLPAVLNIPGAVQALTDGESVQVDGFAGTVRRLDWRAAA